MQPGVPWVIGKLHVGIIGVRGPHAAVLLVMILTTVHSTCVACLLSSCQRDTPGVPPRVPQHASATYHINISLLTALLRRSSPRSAQDQQAQRQNGVL